VLLRPPAPPGCATGALAWVGAIPGIATPSIVPLPEAMYPGFGAGVEGVGSGFAAGRETAATPIIVCLLLPP
jgi:hypothetical protein